MTSCQEFLSDSYVVDDVSFGKKPENVVHENEVLPSDNPESVLQRLINHGSFKHIHCRLCDLLCCVVSLFIVSFHFTSLHNSSHSLHSFSLHNSSLTPLITHITHFTLTSQLITSHHSHHFTSLHNSSHSHPLAGVNKEDGYLYYTPSSLPYNPTAPLRNTIPYIPLDISDDGVHVSNIIPPEYVNSRIRKYVEDINKTRTQKDVEEMKFIKERLQLKKVSENLMMLGSVLEDDRLSLSSDSEDELAAQFKSTTDVSSEEYIPHYPPRTLKEIYSLPHKNRGDLKEGLVMNSNEIANVMNMVENSQLSQQELDELLNEGDTANLSDVGAFCGVSEIAPVFGRDWLDVEGKRVGEGVFGEGPVPGAAGERNAASGVGDEEESEV